MLIKLDCVFVTAWCMLSVRGIFNVHRCLPNHPPTSHIVLWLTFQKSSFVMGDGHFRNSKQWNMQIQQLLSKWAKFIYFCICIKPLSTFRRSNWLIFQRYDIQPILPVFLLSPTFAWALFQPAHLVSGGSVWKSELIFFIHVQKHHWYLPRPASYHCSLILRVVIYQ